VRTRECPALVRTREPQPCVPGSPNDGPRGGHSCSVRQQGLPSARRSTAFSPSWSAGLEKLVRTRECVPGSKPKWTREKKNLPPPGAANPPPPPRPPPTLGRLLSEAGGPEGPPGERKRGGPPSSPGTFADAQTRRPPPLRPSPPRWPASPSVPQIPLSGPPRRRAWVGNLGEEGLTLSRS